MICLSLITTTLFAGTFLESSLQELMPDVQAHKLLQNNDFYELEEHISKKINSEEDAVKKAHLLALQACIYMKDQKEEAAFSSFLQALNTLPQTEKVHMSGNEQKLFEKYLDLYLKTAQPTKEQSEVFAKEIGEHIERHPDYHFLRLLYASSFANRKLYEDFFSHFFQSYIHHPDSYLVPRTLAILNLKLFERGRTVDEKEQYRVKVVDYLHKAIALYDKDPTVYKLLLVYAPDVSKKTLYKEVLQKILTSNTIIPRSEISFYINCALCVEEYEQADELLSKMKACHGYSRTIDEMQNLVQQKKEMRKANGRS